MCARVDANGSFSFVFFSLGFPVKLVSRHFLMSLMLDTRDSAKEGVLHFSGSSLNPRSLSLLPEHPPPCRPTVFLALDESVGQSGQFQLPVLTELDNAKPGAAGEAGEVVSAFSTSTGEAHGGGALCLGPI